MQRRIHRITGLALLLTASVAGAQSPEAPGEAPESTTFTGETVVTATRSEVAADRLPVDVTVMGRTEIEASAAHTMDDVLRQVPAFQLRRDQSSEVASTIETSIAFRGLGGTSTSRALVLLDGIPVNDPFQGYVRWGQIPVELVERVEVVRGGSVVWGNLGIGGMVNLLTADRGRSSDRVALEAGERSRYSVTAGIARRLEDATVGVRGFYRESGGYSRFRAEDRGAVDVAVESEAWTLGASVALTPTDRAVFRVRATAFGETKENVSTLGDRDRANSLSIGLGGQTATSADTYWSFHLFADRLDAASAQARPDRARVTTTPNRDQYDIPADSVGADLQRSIRLGRHELAIGGDARWTEGRVDEYSIWDGSRFTVDRHSGGRQTLAGLYVQDLVQVAERWTLYGALRWDRWESSDGFQDAFDRVTAELLERDRFASRSGSVVSPSIGLTTRVGDRSLVRLALYGGFRAPTLNELYKPILGPSGRIASDPGAEPETLRGVEGSWTWQPSGDSSVGLTLFRVEVEDLITNITVGFAGDEPELIPPCGIVAPGLRCRQRANVGEMRSEGLELSAGYRSSLGYRVRLTGLVQEAVIVSSPEAAQLVGKRVQQAPDWVLGLAVGGPVGSRGSFDVSYRWVSERYDDDVEEDYLGETRSVSVSIGWRLGDGLDARLNVLNAFDRFNPVGISAGSLYRGAPRLVGLSLRWVPGRH